MENILLLIFDVLNFGLLVFLWWFSIKNYKALPKTIPIHFDFDGKADNFGNKKYFYLMPAVLTIVYFLFVFLVSPESSNFPVPITEENENAQFLIMGIFIRWLFLLVALIFLNSQDYMLRYSLNENAKPRVAFPTLLFSIIGSLVVLFIFVGLLK